jgi:hypothetical protein
VASPYITGDTSTFEGGTVGFWQVGALCTLTNTTAQAHTGTHSMRFTASGAYASAYARDPADYPGWTLDNQDEQVDYGIWARAVTTTCHVGLSIHSYGLTDATDYGTHEVLSDPGSQGKAVVAGSWTQLLATSITLPVGTQKITVVVWTVEAAADLYIDDASAATTAPAAPATSFSPPKSRPSLYRARR